MSSTPNEQKGKFSPKNISSRVGRFFRDVRGEVKKIVWPSRKQIINNTIVVIVVTLIAAIFIGGFDMILTAIINLLLGGA